MRFPVLRFFLYWGAFGVVSLVTAFFAGIGYFLLLFAFLHLTTVMAVYWDRAGVAFAGRERHRAMANRIIRMRKSFGLKILFAFVVVIWFALAIVAILTANVRLISLF